MCLQLAHEFGRADVDAFLQEIPYATLTQWLAYFELENERMERERKKGR